VAILAAVAVALVLGLAFGSNSGQRAAREAVAAQTAAENTARMFEQERDTLKESLTALTARMDDLESDLTSATTAAEHWRERAEDASATAAAIRDDNTALKAEVARLQQMKRTTTPAKGATTTVASTGGTWSKAQVASTLTAAASKYGLTPAQTAWVVDTGCRIAYRESTYRTAVVNASGHAGLFQFSKSWGTLAERTDPVWSCYRFVRVYAEGGESAIRRHWRATV
jgi:prophage DNA circulation protein